VATADQVREGLLAVSGVNGLGRWSNSPRPLRGSRTRINGWVTIQDRNDRGQRKASGMDPTYSVMAMDALAKALRAANRHDRAILMDEAIRLHRIAVEGDKTRGEGQALDHASEPRSFRKRM
jgi:hypothetical protein